MPGCGSDPRCIYLGPGSSRFTGVWRRNGRGVWAGYASARSGHHDSHPRRRRPTGLVEDRRLNKNGCKCKGLLMSENVSVVTKNRRASACVDLNLARSCGTQQAHVFAYASQREIRLERFDREMDSARLCRENTFLTLDVGRHQCPPARRGGRIPCSI